MPNFAHTALLFISVLLLQVSGCSSFQQQSADITQPDPQYNWSESKEELKRLTRWNLIGKLGVRSPSNNFTAAINSWQQSRDAYTIDLSSTFFGLGATRLLGDSEILTILEAGEEPISSTNPNLLVYETLGLPLPLDSVTHWIKGLPSQEAPYEITFNKAGLPKILIQSGWSIEFKNHRLYQNVPLPHKIKLTNESTKITLAIKEWTIKTP